MNHWGPPDDEVDFPDWMLPDNHPRKMKTPQRPAGKSFNDAIADVMAKPSIPFTPDDLMRSVMKQENNE